MNLDQELARTPTKRDTVLTVGVFDGVHRGHQHLIARVVSEAKSSNRLAGVVTFRNHPLSVLRPGFAPHYLTTYAERVRLIKALGVDVVVPITFDLEVSKLRAGEFVGRLQKHLRMKALVIGPGFAMGRNREGDAETLAALGREMGFPLTVVEPLSLGGKLVKSTSIREAIARGDIATASMLMGRNPSLTGTVVKGFGRGKDLGAPTANLKVPEGIVIPADGIYAAWAHVGSDRHMAAASIGTSPTFEEGKHAIEAFVLDFEGDLYRRQVRLEFARRLRDEVKYDTVEELREQIGRDVDMTRTVLEAGG